VRGAHYGAVELQAFQLQFHPAHPRAQPFALQALRLPVAQMDFEYADTLFRTVDKLFRVSD